MTLDAHTTAIFAAGVLAGFGIAVLVAVAGDLPQAIRDLRSRRVGNRDKSPALDLSTITHLPDHTPPEYLILEEQHRAARMTKALIVLGILSVGATLVAVLVAL
jgi:hypothetical protein